MARKLNTRQVQFAVKVAEGNPLVTAYREVYKPANDKAASVYQNAKRSARHPGIAARIKELQLELLPDPGDVRAIRAHAMAVIVGLSLNAQDEKVRMRSAEWLHEETGRQIAEQERLEGARVVPAANSPEAIFEELRGLYQKALPGAAQEQEPLVVKAAPGEE